MKVSIVMYCDPEDAGTVTLGIIKGSSTKLAKKVALDDLNSDDDRQAKLKLSKYSKASYDVHERYLEEDDTGKQCWSDWMNTGATVWFETRTLIGDDV